MNAKLLVFIIMLVFSSNVFAEYYLVYPVANVACEQCYQPKHKKRHVAYRKKRVYKRVVHRAPSYRVTKLRAPCAGVVTCSTCGGEAVRTTCGRPDYIVYTAHSTDCLTYEGVLAGEGEE